MNGKSDLEKRLKLFPCFSFLDELSMAEFVRSGTCVTFRKDKALYYQSDKAEFVYFVLSGKIKRIKYRSDDTSVVLGVIQDGDWVGLPEVVAEGPYLTDVIAEDNTEVFSIIKARFKQLLNIPKFKDYIFKTMAKEFYVIHNHFESHTPIQKITKFFKARIETFGEKDPFTGHYIIAITQDELAELVDFTRETVNKHLRVLENKGIIKISRAQIEIVDVHQL